jgi:hypothetical protein
VTNYDAITNAFNPALSDLARRMYAVMFDHCTSAIYLASWYLDEILGEDTGLDAVWPSPGNDAMKELIDARLVRLVTDLGCRYELTSAAWRAHLQAERAEKERAKEQTPAKPPSSLGNCANCGIELDNVTTGMVVVHRESRHITVCGPCADSLVARKLYTVVAQAKSLLDDAIEGRR